MDSQAILAVSAAVVGLTQLIKWMGVPQSFRPALVLVISAFGVALWAYTQPEMITRTELWSYFSGWIAVSTSAAGVFGFTQAATNPTR